MYLLEVVVVVVVVEVVEAVELELELEELVLGAVELELDELELLDELDELVVPELEVEATLLHLLKFKLFKITLKFYKNKIITILCNNNCNYNRYYQCKMLDFQKLDRHNCILGTILEVLKIIEIIIYIFLILKL